MMDDQNFSGDLPGIIIDAAQKLQNDYSLFRISYDNLRKQNNKLSLENNKLMGADLKSGLISRREFGLIRNALEGYISTLKHQHDPEYHVYDPSDPYVGILKKLDHFADNTENDVFKILESS